MRSHARWNTDRHKHIFFPIAVSYLITCIRSYSPQLPPSFHICFLNLSNFLHGHGLEAIYFVLGNLSVATPPKIYDFLFPKSHNHHSSSPRSGGLMISSSVQDGMLTCWPAQSCASLVLGSTVTVSSRVQWPCHSQKRADSVPQHSPLPLPFAFFLFLLSWALEEGTSVSCLGWALKSYIFLALQKVIHSSLTKADN